MKNEALEHVKRHLSFISDMYMTEVKNARRSNHLKELSDIMEDLTKAVQVIENRELIVEAFKNVYAFMITNNINFDLCSEVRRALMKIGVDKFTLDNKEYNLIIGK